MTRVLFVDDEPNILSGIQRMLRAYREQFVTATADGGEAALALLVEQSFDILVSDMRMPGVNGVQLLKVVKDRYPGIIRLALTGHAETEVELECAQIAHQFLMKPIGAEALVNTLQSAIALQADLKNETLKQTIGGTSALPSLPRLYQRILDEAASPDGSLQTIGNIISEDVAMTAKILQLVNSPFFGLKRHIASPAQAATILGLDILKSLVLNYEIFSAFEEAAGRLDLNQLTLFSQQTGMLASKLAQQEGLPRKQCDLAAMCGMLHQCGKLILASQLGLNYEQQATHPHWLWEKQQTGITHADAGAYMLSIWGLPNSIVEAVMYSVHPSNCANQSLSLLTVTHVASALLSNCHEGEISSSLDDRLDYVYLQRLGLENRLPVWKQLALDAVTTQGNTNP